MCGKKIIGSLILLAAVLTFAQSSLHLNFHDDGNGNVFISQTEKKCDSCTFSEQLDSVSMTGYVLDTLLKNVWEPIEQADGTTYGTISLNSDLNLGQFKSDDISAFYNPALACAANHLPLTFKAKKGAFKGNGYTISNMCYLGIVDFDYVKMTGPVGFFEKLDSVEVSDVKFRKVKISISGSSATSTSCTNCFYSVGSMAGEAHKSTFDGIALDSVYVNSLLAGGVVGLSWNSSYSDVSSVSLVQVENYTSLNVSSGVSPVKNIEWTNIYTAFLGGVAGYAVNSGFTKIDLAVGLENDTAINGNYGVMGGVAGLNSYESGSGLDLQMDGLKVHGASGAMALIRGGSAMGGLFGAIRPYKEVTSAATSDITIKNSSFYGKIYGAPAYAFNITVGGFVGYSGQGNSSLKIQGSTSEFAFEESRLTRDSLYAAGGFLGMGPTGMVNGSGYLSISDSKATGSITYTSLVTSTSDPTSFYAGGLAGFAFFNVDDKSISNVTVKAPITVSVKQATSADEIVVGGLVGKAGISEGAKNSMVVSDASYSGGIRLDGKMGSTYVGGAIGHFYKGENNGSVSFENVSISQDTLIAIGSGSTTNGNSFAGGLCGRCTSPTKISSVGVRGDISVDGTFTETDSLFIGGLIGKINASNSMSSFSMINNFYNGKISTTNSGSYVYVGYLAGLLRMTNGSTSYDAKSNYHYGTDEVEIFGDFYGVDGKDWANVKVCSESSTNRCWYKSRNVRNGTLRNIVDDDSNGVVIGAFMKSTDMVKFLNAPWEEDVWEYDETTKLPVQKAAALNSTTSSSSEEEVESSSSEKVTSSSSVEPESSSSKELESSSSEYIEEPASSSSEKEIASSSSAKSSSSSADVVVSSSSESVESSSSEVESSSATVVEVVSSSSEESFEYESSSSEEAVESSSSQQTVSSSSVEDVIEVSSSAVNVVEVSSSSEPLVWRAGSWNIVSLKALKQQHFVPTKDDYLYRWDENTLIGEFWQYRAYGFKGDENDEEGFWFQSAQDVVLEHNEKIPEGAVIEWVLDSVNSGWNLVANPYGEAIDLSCDELKNVTVWRRNSAEGNYNPESKVLGPYEGAWIKVSTATTIRFAAKPVAAGKSLQKADFVETEGWSLKAMLSDDYGKVDSWNVMGAASREEVTEEPPAGMGSYVRLSIVEDDVLLAKSLKVESEEMSWNVRLSASNSRDGFLKLDGVDKVNALGKKVYVTVDGRTTEMSEGKSLKVALKTSAKTAVVTVSSAGKAVVAGSSAIQNLRGIRSAEGLNVNFEVSGALMGQAAKVDVVSVSGKVVATARINAMAGNNSVSLNVKDRGLYIVRVRVGSQSSVKNINLQ